MYIICLNYHTKPAWTRWPVVPSCQRRCRQAKKNPAPDLAQAGQVHKNRDFSFFHLFSLKCIHCVYNLLKLSYKAGLDQVASGSIMSTEVQASQKNPAPDLAQAGQVHKNRDFSFFSVFSLKCIHYVYLLKFKYKNGLRQVASGPIRSTEVRVNQKHPTLSGPGWTITYKFRFYVF